MYATRSARSGFSLIEIMVAIAIIALMAAVVAPAVMRYFQGAKRSAALGSLRGFKQAISVYELQTGQLPETLKDLVRRPSNETVAANWQDGGYLTTKDIPKDPWTNNYQYRPTPEGEHPYDLYSYGPKGKGAPRAEWINVWTAR